MNEITPQMKRRIARKIDNQYVVEKTGTDDEWYSEDGHNWVDQDGIPVTSKEFLDSSILFIGGDRDGETVDKVKKG